MLAIVALLGSSAGTIGRVGAPSPGQGVPLWQATAVETAATFLLLVISATAEDPRAPSGWAPLAIGVALAVSVALFEPITGAGMNPARAFGPDLIYATLFGGNVNWLDYLVADAIGPILGAVWLYRVMAPTEEQAKAFVMSWLQRRVGMKHLAPCQLSNR